MSTSPLEADPSIGRLLSDGYALAVEGNHLLVQHIPYIAANRTVKHGRLALPVTLDGGLVRDASGDHRIWFIGEQPYDESGNLIPGFSPDTHAVTPELAASFMISSKPKHGAGFADIYQKITSYVRVLTHPAQSVDPAVTGTPGARWQEFPDDLPFVYPDTATSRAGLAAMNAKFRGHRIGIVGVGGTGSYILDQVSKTWVDEIHLYDGDVLDLHNAYRAPGAVAVDDLRQRPNKAEYFAALYSHMHTGITAHAEFITTGNLELLSTCTFVFMAAADAPDKPAIVAWLREQRIPVIEVGMGISEEQGQLSGLLAATSHFPDQPSSLAANAAPVVDDYDRNIQIAELNCLNAVLAVINWKKYLGYYADLKQANETVYKIFTGTIRHGGADEGEQAVAEVSP